jgi:hypothetical protein
MLFNIPQFIDKEDKIVGPLTAKQLGWMFGAGGVMLLLWAVLDITAFIVASIPVMAIFGGLAFYRPNNMSLIAFLFSSVQFFFRPKMYVWKREPDMIQVKKKTPKKVRIVSHDIRVVNSEKIEAISHLLDDNSHSV